VPTEVERRWFLISKAAEILPLDKAFSLAQEIESFIVRGSGTSVQANGAELVSVQEVIGYLRDQGATVEQDGSGYLLNSQIVTYAELVQRANAQRRQQGLAQFAVYSSN
jgi:hypothetical protein